MRPYKIIISGGGTGGHIYPAIAIANALKERYPLVQLLFVGAKDRMEMEKVPQAGYDIKGLWISGLQRNLKLKNLSFPLKLASSLIASRKIIKQFRPDMAIGTGGYASAPLLRVASMRNIPCLIQEQNSHAGITNKWLSKRVQTICVAYPNMERFFPSHKIVFTGNPVRQDLLKVSHKKEEALGFFNLKKDKKTLLVLGGSLGARRINEIIHDKKDFLEQKGLQLIWQCGNYYYETYKDQGNSQTQIHAFLNRMDLAYAAADIIISRAGALSVSELCLVGKPVIFIPSPNVAEDHQTKNARSIVSEGAALMIAEKELDESFETVMTNLLNDPIQQETLSKNILRLAKPNATDAIVDEIEKLLPKLQ